MVPALESGVIQTGFLSSGYGNYFHITPDTTDSVAISFHCPQASNQLHSQLFAQSGSPPTTTAFDYYAGGPSSATVQLNLPTAPGETWYIAGFADSPCNYTLTAVVDPVNCTNCANGQCINGLCMCNPNWYGPNCDIRAKLLSTNNQTGVAYVDRWNLYVLPANLSAKYVSVHLLETQSEGLVWTFLNPKTPPTLTSFKIADREGNTQHHSVSLDNPDGETMFVGVTASPLGSVNKAYAYAIEAWTSPFKK